MGKHTGTSCGACNRKVGASYQYDGMTGKVYHPKCKAKPLLDDCHDCQHIKYLRGWIAELEKRLTKLESGGSLEAESPRLYRGEAELADPPADSFACDIKPFGAWPDDPRICPKRKGHPPPCTFVKPIPASPDSPYCS